MNANRPQFDNVNREATSIYRSREVLEFPKGVVDSVRIFQTENQDVFEVEIVIGTQAVLLKLGEVDGDNSTLRIMPNDESILLFLNADDAKRVNFHDSFSIL